MPILLFVTLPCLFPRFEKGRHCKSNHHQKNQHTCQSFPKNPGFAVSSNAEKRDNPGQETHHRHKPTEGCVNNYIHLSFRRVLGQSWPAKHLQNNPKEGSPQAKRGSTLEEILSRCLRRRHLLGHADLVLTWRPAQCNQWQTGSTSKSILIIVERYECICRNFDCNRNMKEIHPSHKHAERVFCRQFTRGPRSVRPVELQMRPITE